MATADRSRDLEAAAALRQPRTVSDEERFNGGIGGAEDFFADLEFCHEFIRAQQRSHDELHGEWRRYREALERIAALHLDDSHAAQEIARQALQEKP